MPMMAGNNTAPAAIVFMKYDSTRPPHHGNVNRQGVRPPNFSKRSPIQRVTPVRYRPLVMMNNAMTVITAERLKPEKTSAGGDDGSQARLINTSKRDQIGARDVEQQQNDGNDEDNQRDKRGNIDHRSDRQPIILGNRLAHIHDHLPFGIQRQSTVASAAAWPVPGSPRRSP